MMTFHYPKSTLLATLALSMALVGCNTNETASNATSMTSTAEDNSSGSISPISSASAALPSANSNTDVVNALQANFEASGIDKKIVSAVPTDMPNIYWVTAEGVPAFFTDKEGKHIIQGQIVQIGDEEPVDISTKFLAMAAQNQLAQVDKKDMIIYPANGETKAVVYAFTDADCGYCRKLHSEMDDINNEGIEVRYLAWPRSDQTIPKMEGIWCSADRNAAMDAAKAGADIPATSANCDNPVTAQVNLGFSLGVSGTPAIFTESGQKIGGYMPASDLAKAAIAN